MKENLDGTMLHHYVQQNHNYALKDHQDWMTLVSGPEGAGKSTMAAQVVMWYDPEFDPGTQTIYDAESLMQFYDMYEDVPGKVGWLDEAVALLLGEENQTEEARLFKKMFVSHRDLEKRYVLCAPSPWLLSPYYRQWRIRDFILVYIDQMSKTFERRAAYYSRAAYIPFVVSPQAKNQIPLPQKFIAKYKPTVDMPFPKFRSQKFTELFQTVRVLKKQFQRDLRKDIKELIAHERALSEKTPRLADEDIIQEVKDNLQRYTREWHGRTIVNAGMISTDYGIGGRRAERVKQVIIQEALH